LTTSSQNDLVHLHNRASSSARSTADARTSLLTRTEELALALSRLCRTAAHLDEAAEAIIACLLNGGRVLVAGNGGSAAEAQHFATELVGRFLRERAPYAVISLTADTAILTAVANDYGYDQVFARQVRAYARPGDVFVGFSTSGKSPNVVEAAKAARDLGVTVIVMTGEPVSPLANLAEIPIRVPATDTPTIQELHTVVLHVLCDLVERALVASELTAEIAQDRAVAVR
jgi:D-sedoheptulose 7-phosphate isomerase